MVAGDYYGILSKQTMGRIEEKGRDIVSTFSSFPFSSAHIFHMHPSLIFNCLGDKRRLGTIESALTVHLP